MWPFSGRTCWGWDTAGCASHHYLREITDDAAAPEVYFQPVLIWPDQSALLEGERKRRRRLWVNCDGMESHYLACKPWWQKDERITSAKALLFCSWLALDWVELNLWSADAFAFAPERSMITCGSTGSVMKPHRMYMWNRIDQNRMPSLIPNWGNLHNYSKQNVVQGEGKFMLIKRKWK